jgi:hypothetical protein
MVMTARSSARCFPGRLTLEQWLALPAPARDRLIGQAQCDLLGSFRCCANKKCRRQRTCCAPDPLECRNRIRSRRAKAARAAVKAGKRGDPRTSGLTNMLLAQWARLSQLADL